MGNTARAAVTGCLLGNQTMEERCQDCARCGWNPKVANARKEERRKHERERLEILRLRDARAHEAPDQNGWYSIKKAMPELMERVIVTDGVFVGEAYFGPSGWTREGKTLPAAALGIARPTAWMPLPIPDPGRKGKGAAEAQRKK